MKLIFAGPIFTEWYWAPIFTTLALIPWAIGATLIAGLGYSAIFYIRKQRNPNQTYQFITKRKVIILGAIIALGAFPYLKQAQYISRSQSNPHSSPCQRLLCLDNYFPVTIPASQVDISKIDFTVYLPNPAPKGFTLRFLELNHADSSRWYVQGKNFLNIEYHKNKTAFELTQTKLLAEQETLSGTPSTTPKGRLIYQRGNTEATVIVGQTVVYINGYHIDDRKPPAPELIELVDSLIETDPNTLVFKPRG